MYGLCDLGEVEHVLACDGWRPQAPSTFTRLLFVDTIKIRNVEPSQFSFYPFYGQIYTSGGKVNASGNVSGKASGKSFLMCFRKCIR